MAILTNRRTGADLPLQSRTLVGRSSRADIRLTGEAASHEHALIFWDGGDWVLRDLTSRNGTKLNGTLLIGRQWRLAVGDDIVFGDPDERWSWTDASPPQARAVRDDDVVTEAVHGMLLLPDQERPKTSIYVRGDRYEMDLGGSAREVQDGEVVVVDGRRFRLTLPAIEPTAERTRTVLQRHDLLEARATFRVSKDQENIELTLHTREGPRALGARAFHYMLLVLARARLSDLAAGVAPEEAGWTYTDDLATKLGVSPQLINVDAHRARNSMAATGLFANPVDIIQRRRSSGQLRFGLAQIEIDE